MGLLEQVLVGDSNAVREVPVCVVHDFVWEAQHHDLSGIVVGIVVVDSGELGAFDLRECFGHHCRYRIRFGLRHLLYVHFASAFS